MILQAVVLLRDLKGLSTAETADALGLSIMAVKSRLFRARLCLRQGLGKVFGPADLGPF
jgi:RNA polymerase sigma-70 factor, ECF subfamily